MKPRVLNKRTDKIPPDAVYVGRPTKWGNQFVIGKEGNRNEVIRKYRAYIIGEATPWGILDLSELRGKDLVCWCSPLPCHADVLMELSNGSSDDSEG
ncbi:hypothetical protein LCGC14_1734220 [marine sediment metagenome]|uniref:DUF4326 domain-containing protein n=1 Tax=marine sediment metagenome TaxID=412755 RepID=A0A0F9JP26_9ZZZZ